MLSEHQPAQQEEGVDVPYDRLHPEAPRWIKWVA